MCNIRILSLTLGWLQIIFYSIFAIATLYAICFNNVKIDEQFIEKYSYDNSTTGENNSTTIFVETKTQDEKLAYLIIVFFLTFISLLVTALLVKGILQQRPLLMTPYIFMAYFSIAFAVATIIVTIIENIVNGNSFGRIILEFFIYVTILGLEILFFTPIYLMYQQLCHNPPPSERQHLNNSTPIHRVNNV